MGKGDPVPKGTHTVGYRYMPEIAIPHDAGTVYIPTEFTECLTVYLTSILGSSSERGGDKLGEDVLSIDPDLSQASAKLN